MNKFKPSLVGDVLRAYQEINTSEDKQMAYNSGAYQREYTKIQQQLGYLSALNADQFFTYLNHHLASINNIEDDDIKVCLKEKIDSTNYYFQLRASRQIIKAAVYAVLTALSIIISALAVLIIIAVASGIYSVSPLTAIPYSLMIPEIILGVFTIGFSGFSCFNAFKKRTPTAIEMILYQSELSDLDKGQITNPTRSENAYFQLNAYKHTYTALLIAGLTLTAEACLALLGMGLLGKGFLAAAVFVIPVSGVVFAAQGILTAGFSGLGLFNTIKKTNTLGFFGSAKTNEHASLEEPVNVIPMPGTQC